MKRKIGIILFIILVVSGCTASVGLGTGFNIGGIGLSSSVSSDIKKAKKDTEKNIQNLEQEKEIKDKENIEN